MNVLRLLAAAIGGTVAYFVLGFLAFALLPLKKEFAKYPAVYRSQDGIKTVMPYGMLGIFLSALALAMIYAALDRHSTGLIEGVRFGALIGIFVMGAFVLHNYVNLNIGLTLTMQQAIVYFVEWTMVGLVIGLIYSGARSTFH
jgi:hypothetical protein